MASFAKLRSAPRRAAPRRDGDRVGMDTDLMLCFDCETTVDFSQRLRVGGYQIKQISTQTVIGMGFFTGETSPGEAEVIREYISEFNRRVIRLKVSEGKPEMREPTKRANPGEYDRISKTPEEIRADRISWAREYRRRNREARKEYAPTQAYVERNGVELLTRDQFANLLLGHLQAGGAVCGHNVGFDFGAIQTGFWTHETGPHGTGFFMSMCNCPDRTITPIKVGSRRINDAARISCLRHPTLVTTSMGGKKIRYSLCDERENPIDSGPIIDSLTLGRALAGPGGLSLDKLGEKFECHIRKRESPIAHGAPITMEYLDYLTTDILAGMCLIEREFATYAAHGLDTPVTMIYSEASLGKALYKQIGITPHLTDRMFTREDTGLPDRRAREVLRWMREGYCGARSEVRMRLKPVQVAVVDYLSQYPTICNLLDLQSLLIADHYEIWMNETTRQKATDILNRADLEWLRDGGNWPFLRIMVQVDPTGCLLPMRWKAENVEKLAFGLVTPTEYPELKWIPISDAIACKLETGRAPIINAAVWFHPVGTLPTTPHDLFGRRRVDVQENDLFGTVIDERLDVKRQLKAAKKRDKDERRTSPSPHIAYMEAYILALKLLANSTSYGILAETIFDGGFEAQGRFYSPHLVAHITGGGRLLLSMAERLAHDIGMRRFGKPILAGMCDTDGVAFMKPENATIEEFDEAIAELTNWFGDLSPYEATRDMLDREINTPLYMLAVSCKRYCLYEKTADGKGIKRFRKISSHGAGDKMFDNDAEGYDLDHQELSDELSPVTLADEAASDRDDKPVAKAWQEIMWTRAIQRAEGWRKPKPEERDLPCGFPKEDWNSQLTRSQVSITTPGLLNTYARLPGMRPFSFFLRITPGGKGKNKIRMFAPFNRTQAGILSGDVVNLDTGRKLFANEVLRNGRTLWESMAGYFAHPESKSQGEWTSQVWRNVRVAIQKPGYLRRPTAIIGSAIRVNRKGKVETSGQGEFGLFDWDNENAV